MSDPKKPENPSLIEGEVGERLGTPVYWTEVTLRDLFAGFALAGLIAQPQSLASAGQAGYAYEAADEMLRERAAVRKEG